MIFGGSKTQALILAAGNSSRMHSEVPKVLHKVGNLELLNHNLCLLEQLNFNEAIVVCDPHLQFKNVTGVTVRSVFQHEKKGTAHAVACALTELQAEKTIILYGDVPLISLRTLKILLEQQDHDAILAVFLVKDSLQEYGRVLVEGKQVIGITEYGELSEVQRQQENLANSGIFCITTELLKKYVTHVKASNARGEYYLTDVINLIVKAGRSIGFHSISESEGIGVNTHMDLAQAERFFQEKMRLLALSSGVRLFDPSTVYFSYDTQLEPGTVVHQNVIFLPGVRISSGAEILPFSVLEGVKVGSGAKVGPFARIRGDTSIGAASTIGNFVEIKNSTLARDVKVKHLSYIGDASVGEKTNIGAGTVICNFDFEYKHHTQIDAKCYIGGNNAIVAPVRIHKGARTAAGSTITSDIPSGEMGISRAMQVNKPIK